MTDNQRQMREDRERKCEKCVLTKYCTRKNIYKNDGYCRMEEYGTEARERALYNALWLVGDERVKEQPNADICMGKVTLTYYAGMPAISNEEYLYRLDETDIDTLLKWLNKHNEQKRWLKEYALNFGRTDE